MTLSRLTNVASSRRGRAWLQPCRKGRYQIRALTPEVDYARLQRNRRRIYYAIDFKKSSILWVVAVLFTSLPARAGDVIDRILATVNGHVILQSDWEDGLRYEAFVAGRRPDHLSAEDRKAILDRLIDQELLREQMQASDSQHAPAEEVTKRIQEIRKQHPGAETEEGWRAALAGYGLTEDSLKRRVGVEFDLTRLVDTRLRPTVNIDAKSIEGYYNQELLLQLRQSGATDVPLSEVISKIKELLTQQKMNQLLTAWLQSLHAGSEIHSGVLSPDSQGEAR
jgi:peptidyl-prolyl cis-trans isomerase SurA